MSFYMKCEDKELGMRVDDIDGYMNELKGWKDIEHTLESYSMKYVKGLML